MKHLKSLLIINLLLAAGQTISRQMKGYYRYPVIYGKNVIFTAEGDLWKFNLTTNEVKILTASPR